MRTRRLPARRGPLSHADALILSGALAAAERIGMPVGPELAARGWAPVSDSGVSFVTAKSESVNS